MRMHKGNEQNLIIFVSAADGMIYPALSSRLRFRRKFWILASLGQRGEPNTMVQFRRYTRACLFCMR
jgi:hypothetical protein